MCAALFHYFVYFMVCKFMQFLCSYLVSLELLVQDVKQTQRGFENAKTELIHNKNNIKLKVSMDFMISR